MAFFITRIAREFDVVNYRWAAWRKLHALKWDAKTVDFFGGQKLEVCIINAPKCVRLLRNSNYFFRDVPERNNQNIIYCPTSKQIFLGTNRNIEKASHALLAYHLLNDRLYLVYLEVGGTTEDGNLVNKSLHALKKKKTENFTRFHNLCFISFTVYFSMAHVGRFFRKVPYFVDSNLNLAFEHLQFQFNWIVDISRWI